MSIDPYNDVEIYKVDIEDKIVEVITLTDTPKKKTEETSSQKVTNPPTQSITLTASTSKQENIVVTDITGWKVVGEVKKVGKSRNYQPKVGKSRNFCL